MLAAEWAPRPAATVALDDGCRRMETHTVLSAIALVACIAYLIWGEPEARRG